MLGTIPAISWG